MIFLFLVAQKDYFQYFYGAMVEGGLLKNDKLARYNGKLSVDHKVNDILKSGYGYALHS